MHCYTELTPPTGVTHSVSLPFLSATANNLVVAKTSILEVYALKSVLQEESAETLKSAALQNGRTEKVARKERSHVSKLVLISQIEISGTITALARVKSVRSKSGGELLLVSLKDAKLSLVEWDLERHAISTVSIHYYERDDLQNPPWTPSLDQYASTLTVDPGSRCAALKFGARNVAILPLGQSGDDLAMDDLDHEVDAKVKRRHSSLNVNGETTSPTSSAPFSSSFVLSLVALDPMLTYPIHLSFLHEYREPTMGVLFSQKAASSALLHERPDPLSYNVYTLDLEQRASTTLLSVPKLPYDLHTIKPLPSPVGGALLIGSNEIIHVDQAGKTNGLAVNELAALSSSFPMTSQSSLGMKLEGCVIEQFGQSSGELLVITRTGQMAVLNFKIEGRSVSGLSIEIITNQGLGSPLSAAPSCTSIVGRGRVFVGSEDANSLVLGWSVKTVKQLRRRQSSEMKANEDDLGLEGSEAESLEDDDLYADAKPENDQRRLSTTYLQPAADDYTFVVHDSLLNLAPLGSIKTIQSRPSSVNNDAGQSKAVDLVAITGRGNKSSLVRLSSTVKPVVKKDMSFAGPTRIWSIHVQNDNVEHQYDNVIFTSNVAEEGAGYSNILAFQGGEVERIQNCDFEPEAGLTVEVGTLMGGLRIVQVMKSEVRVFDGDFGLAQIVPVLDEASEGEPAIVAAAFAEPFILLLRDDFRVQVLRADDSGDLEEVETQGILSSAQWRAGSLFDDVNDVFRLTNEEIDEDATSILMFLLTTEGGLQIFRLPNLSSPVYTALGLSFLPGYLSPEFDVRRSTARETLTEILVAEVGDTVHKTPLLILRSSNDDLILYSPYQDPGRAGSNSSLQFSKVSAHYLPPASSNALESSSSDPRKEPLRFLSDVGGFSAVFMPGPAPCLIIKSASFKPRIIAVDGDGIRGLSGLHTDQFRQSIISVDQAGLARIISLPPLADYSTGWVVEEIYSGKALRAFDYHAISDRFVLGTGENVEFKLPEDEHHPEWSLETISSLPTIRRDTIDIFDPTTGMITDSLQLEQNETVTCIEVMSLEVSENSHKRRALVVAGTAILKGEDLNAQGCVYVLDVIDVVPEPDRPETGRKFKLLAKVKEKGAVTAISQVGTEGFVLAAQGQKCLVRGLKEDNTFLPVAFMDMQCYVSVAKELRGTGLCILGDAVKGLWFAGYTEDPYNLKLFGKSARDTEVVAAEFLPDGRGLQVVLAAADGTIEVQQFDPQNPKSLAGQHLLHLSSFFSGDYIRSMTLLPRIRTSWEIFRKEEGEDEQDAPNAAAPPAGGVDPPNPPIHQILVASASGALSLITPTSAQHYRSLASLQSWLGTTLSHPLGLGPKSYRDVDVDLSVGGKAMLDGNVLRRWVEIGSWRRGESILRAGVDFGWEIRAMLESVGGRGLGFL